MAEAIYVRLDPQARAALHDLAALELRDPRDQAVLLLREALRVRGLLPDKQAADVTDAGGFSMSHAVGARETKPILTPEGGGDASL